MLLYVKHCLWYSKSIAYQTSKSYLVQLIHTIMEVTRVYTYTPIMVQNVINISATKYCKEESSMNFLQGWVLDKELKGVIWFLTIIPVTHGMWFDGVTLCNFGFLIDWLYLPSCLVIINSYFLWTQPHQLFSCLCIPLTISSFPLKWLSGLGLDYAPLIFQIIV